MGIIPPKPLILVCMNSKGSSFYICIYFFNTQLGLLTVNCGQLIAFQRLVNHNVISGRTDKNRVDYQLKLSHVVFVQYVMCPYTIFLMFQSYEKFEKCIVGSTVYLFISLESLRVLEASRHDNLFLGFHLLIPQTWNHKFRLTHASQRDSMHQKYMYHYYENYIVNFVVVTLKIRVCWL